MLISDIDRKHIEGKYHGADFDPFNRFVYHGYAYDESTGLSDEEIKAGVAALAESLEGEDHAVAKSKMFEYVLNNTRIDINEHDYFVGIYTWDRVLRDHTLIKWIYEAADKVALELGDRKRDEFSRAGYAWTSLDFDHNVPDWDAIASLGIVGLIDRIDESHRALGESGKITPKQENYYGAMRRELCAVRSLIKRLYEYSLTKDFPKARLIGESLKNLSEGAPKTTLDILQLTYIFFMVTESTDLIQVRSLGHGLDDMLYPFYKRDIESGRFTKEQIKSFIAYFFIQFHAIGNYWGQPFYLGGSTVEGDTRVNEMSYILLDVYRELEIYNPKIQIKVSPSTPRDFLDKALDMVISGRTSIVFCNDETIIKAIMNSGGTREQGVYADIKGCYEYAYRTGRSGISTNVINALKSVVLVFSNGVDPTTGLKIGIDTGDLSEMTSFEEFKAAYYAQLDHLLCELQRSIGTFEKYSAEISPAIMHSSTYSGCAEKLCDMNDGGIPSVADNWVAGFASVVDSLMAVYELVFEKQTVTLMELGEALRNDWEGYENLRLRALGCTHKFGRGDVLADECARELHEHISDFVHAIRRERGRSIYFIHSARGYIELGRQTEATPDGRRAGEEMSKNVSPVIGMDTKGVTALIRSATSLDLSLADSGACLDCMLHPTAVQGEGGRDILFSVLDTYMKRGGASIHFNIFDADMLREAQKHPEKYEGLQVRVCGWNTLWNNMSRNEQEAYIKRAEAIAQ